MQARGWRSNRIAVVAALIIVAGGGSRTAIAAEAYDLVLNVPPGDKLAYRLDSRSEGVFQGSKFLNTVQADVEVARVTGARSDNLIFAIEFVHVEAFAFNGTERVPQKLGLDGRKVQVEVTMRGHVVQVAPPDGVSQTQAQLLENFANAIFLELPPKPVKVRETWKIQLAHSGTSGTGDYTLAAAGPKADAKNGPQVAKLVGHLQVAGTSPPLQGTGQVECEVALSGGYVVASKGRVQLKGADGASIVQSYELALKH